MKQITVKLNYLRIAPRKVRMVADLVRGLSVNEAEAQLLMEKRRPAKPLLKLLRSAVAAAQHNYHLKPENLYIKSLRVDQGPMLKRYLPRARGVATPIQKKMSHVTLILDENLKINPPRFKIMVEKKEKNKGGKKEEPFLPPEKNFDEKPTETPPQKPGFFKKIFNRKSGFAK